MAIEIKDLIELLHSEGCSCVIYSCGQITLCRERGVKDLYRILTQQPELLKDALLADKVIGKGAAALMVLGGVKEVYADVISVPALEMLTGNRIPSSHENFVYVNNSNTIPVYSSSGILVTYGKLVPHIINRTGTGICPVETICSDANKPEDCLPLITDFLTRMFTPR